MAVNENSSSGDVVQETLTLAATFAADDDLKRHAAPILEKRKVLKHDMRARTDLDDEARMAHGAVTAGESRTDDYLTSFAEKLAGRFAKPGQPGDESPEFVRIFAGKSAATLLPARRDDRTEQLKELVQRIQDPKSSADLKKDAADLLKVIARELAAVEQERVALAQLKAGYDKEDASRLATVVTARSSRKLVEAELASNLPRMRKILGLSAPGGRRKSKADLAEKTRAEATRLAELARKAAALAQEAEEEAVAAELAAKEEATAQAAKPAKKKAR